MEKIELKIKKPDNYDLPLPAMRPAAHQAWISGHGQMEILS
jgi:hypothetical protein